MVDTEEVARAKVRARAEHILDYGSKWAKIRLFCSPAFILRMLWNGNLWWRPKWIWLLLGVLLVNFKIATYILRGKI